MRCSKCGAENREGARFCNECAAPLSSKCPACAAINKPGAKFCDECGAAMSASAQQPAQPVRFAPQESGAQPPEGERKTVTALFADIKGSMDLMEDLDPEQARAIVDPALRLMIDAAHRYDGYIVQSTGDGIFALFGAPVAHDDHPQRALYAALRMQEELRRYSAKLREAGNLAVEARVGVNTGEVVVRSIRTGDTHTEYTPIGHSTSLAARMQALAPTGSIATTEQTRRLCEGYFSFKALGPTRIRGVSEPVHVVEVTGVGPLRTRLQVSQRRGLTKFVGRKTELEQMRHALELSRDGRGQVVAAMGDPGVGKSRLLFEFKAVAVSGCLVLEAYSVSHGKASAYLPVIDLLKGYFKIAAEDDERARREKVNGKIITLDRSLEDTIPYLLGLLGIVEGDDPLAQFDPQLRRRRTLEAIKRILVRESLNQPLIVIFEDLQWIDSETQALLNLLVDAIATARLLLLVNYRPEYRHQWGSKTCYSQLRLDPLGKESADEMLSALLDSPAPSQLSSPAAAGLPAAANRERSLADIHVGERVREGIAPLKRLIIERTEGNPFFMEEIVQALFEQGALVRNGVVAVAKPIDEIRVPATVQAILASRIDRLSAPDKELLQMLAVLGREFPLGLIKRMAGKPDDDLERMLAELQLGEFIYEQPAMGDIEYQFKHALTQEVAYNSVLSERRRMLHESAAAAIEALFAGRLEDYIPELARHYDRGGNIPKAVEYLERAGQLAARQTAHAEAVGYFTRTLELLKQMPEGADRDRRELDLQMALGWSLYTGRGPAAPEREPILVRAQELSERLGDSAKLMEALLAVALFRFNRRELRPARELGARVLSLAHDANAPAIVGGAHCVLGLSLFFAGELEGAREHFELAPGLINIGTFLASGGNYLTHVLCIQGHPEQALRNSRQLLASARREQQNPLLMTHALFQSGVLNLELRNNSAVTEYGGELLSIATEHELPFFHAMADFLLGWGKAASGQAEEGIMLMGKGMSALTRVAPRLWAGLAEANCKSGRREQGLSTLKEGLVVAEQTGQLMGQSELYRVQGELELLSQLSAEAEAERCFRTAIDIARRQQARWWELRTTTILARLLQRHGKIDEARKMLAEIYNWFTEGFEFADLKEARQLLDDLSA